MTEGAYPPISDYALIGDCHSAALVSRDGSVDWCAFHRFDARPVFARILDWDKGGYFRIAPQGPYEVERRYLPGTNVLETRFEVPGGVLLLTDCMPVQEEAQLPTEKVHPYHQLIRSVRCLEGEVEVVLELSPRFDYGLTVPRLEIREPRLAVVYGGADALVVQSELLGERTGLGGCRGQTKMRKGDRARAVLTYAIPHELRPALFSNDEIEDRLEQTLKFWKEWSGRCTYDGKYADQVLRSALVLKCLTNAPSGAIVAAPTTSLPEKVGGVRNWDYRYTWLRDAALNLYALFTLGYREEAHAFMHWLERTTAGSVTDLQIMYGVGGERLLFEVELDFLEGYRKSRPVRIGNGAVTQFQLDVYGYLLDTAWLYHTHGGELEESYWDFLTGVIDTVSGCWEEPDEGIWEVRSGREHFTFSKVMAWVAVDRAVKLGEALNLPGDIDSWKKLRRAIRQRVEEEGVDPATGTFRRAFGSKEIDAATLLIPLVGFLPGNDPRVRATFERVEKELGRHGLIYRYLCEDGLPPGEGAFVICSFWLVGNLARAGELGRARELFERLIAHSNDVGLLAEEIDVETGDHLGNFPQAFSHVGLIGAAMNLQKAEEKSSRA